MPHSPLTSLPSVQLGCGRRVRNNARRFNQGRLGETSPPVFRNFRVFCGPNRFSPDVSQGESKQTFLSRDEKPGKTEEVLPVASGWEDVGLHSIRGCGFFLDVLVAAHEDVRPPILRQTYFIRSNVF